MAICSLYINDCITLVKDYLAISYLDYHLLVSSTLVNYLLDITNNVKYNAIMIQ